MAGVESEAARIGAQSFFAELMEQVEKVEKVPQHRRKYTGAEFFLREPERFRMVVSYIAGGRGQLWIAERVGCSHHTVRAVAQHFPKAVAIEKERLADTCQLGATLIAERIVEEVNELPANTLVMTLGILMDKAALLRGGPSLTIEHRHTFGHEDFNKLVTEAPAINVESERLPMGYDGEESRAMAISPPARPGGETGATSGRTDAASLVLQSEAPAATLPADLPAPTVDGEEGGPSFDAGGPTTREPNPLGISTNAVSTHPHTLARAG